MAHAHRQIGFSLLVVVAFVRAQGESNPTRIFEKSPAAASSQFFTTRAYHNEALRLVIKEAEKAARELQLPEKFPIITNDLVEAFIPPPAYAKKGRGLGTITTSNYFYSVAVGNKFSFLTKRNLEQDYEQLKTQYFWPMSQMNTNVAYQLATQWLTAASMDVNALNRDCRLGITAFTPEGPSGEHFVPVYWVSWSRKIKPPPWARSSAEYEWKPVATVELFLPTKSLRQLHVNETQYILRKPIVVTNLDLLLSQTNGPASTHVPTRQ